MREIDTLFPPRKRHTTRVKQCLILAAGNGRRLIESSGGAPKPLVQLHGKSLLEHVILGALEAGIERFIIVVGYGADAMRGWLAARWRSNVSVAVVENREYHKDNGISVLKARNWLREPFLLLMADHIFEPRTARALLDEPLKTGEVILAVDPKLDLVFDLDDATKVRRDGDRIVDIGKTIPEYDAFDTGMFLCSPALFATLESAKKEGSCSLSDGMRMLGRDGKLRAFDIGEGTWQDIDTPQALAYAESVFDQRFCQMPSKRVSPMSNPGRRRLALRTLTVVAGVGLLIYLVQGVGTDNLLANVATLGWGLALIIALAGVSHLARALAWRMTLTGWRGKISFLRMLQVRMASEAASQVGILGHLFGDGLRISAFDEALPMDNRISSVILDRALFISAGTIVSGVGILAGLFVLSLNHALQLDAAIFAVTLISLLSLLALTVMKRWRFLSRPAQYLGWNALETG